jgi:hypothetical protein
MLIVILLLVLILLVLLFRGSGIGRFLVILFAIGWLVNKFTGPTTEDRNQQQSPEVIVATPKKIETLVGPKDDKGVKYVYQGEVRDAMPNGQGTMTMDSGVKFVSEFRDGKISGQATEYAPDGTITKSGIWENNEFVRSDSVPKSDLDKTKTSQVGAPIAVAQRGPIPSFPSDCYQVLVHPDTDQCRYTLAQEAEFEARWHPENLKTFVTREYQTVEDARRHGHNFNCTEQCDWTLEDQKLRGLIAQYEADQEKLAPMRKQQQDIDDLINTLHSLGVR